MTKKQYIHISFCILFLCCSVMVFAGDISSFVNFGFSDNSRFFMFGLYGIEDKTTPYAETYIVNVPENSFVPNGVMKASFQEDIQPGQEGLGALFTVFKKIVPRVEQYGINHLKTGRILYLLINGDKPKEHIEFRDFQTGNKYSVHLVQSQYKSDSNVSASFFINLTVTRANGITKQFTVGLPNFRRDGVKSYQIKKILAAPGEEALIFVVQKMEEDGDGVDVRYMVETVYIN